MSRVTASPTAAIRRSAGLLCWVRQGSEGGRGMRGTLTRRPRLLRIGRARFGTCQRHFPHGDGRARGARPELEATCAEHGQKPGHQHWWIHTRASVRVPCPVSRRSRHCKQSPDAGSIDGMTRGSRHLYACEAYVSDRVYASSMRRAGGSRRFVGELLRGAAPRGCEWRAASIGGP